MWDVVPSLSGIPSLSGLTLHRGRLNAATRPVGGNERDIGITWPMVRLPLPLGSVIARSACLTGISETVRSGSIREGHAPRRSTAGRGKVNAHRHGCRLVFLGGDS